MTVLISGSTGLIGSALAESLAAQGHRVGALVRPPRRPGVDDVSWDPAAGQIDAAAIEGFDAVVHLAGESIEGRWTADKRRRILASRVESTSLLAGALAGLDRRPAVLACASAVGFYGDRGEEPLSEDSPCGEGFLPEVCRQWEAAAEPARQAGIRVAHLRFAMVLSRRGGALRRMLPPFLLCLGGPVGSGRQFWSWVALDDAVAAVELVLRTGDMSGPVNVASPHPVTAREFAETLGRALHRPAVLPTPAYALRLALGQFADEVLLASARVVPQRLSAAGFTFRHGRLDEALRAV